MISSWKGAAARHAVLRWCAFERRLQRATNRVTRALGGVAWALCTPEERTRLGLQLHDAFERTTTHARAGLFEWEERWLRRWLPEAPSRVLVGGAGSGRETLALLELGHRVDAFEPAPEAYAELQRNVSGRGATWQLAYQQLSTVGGPVGPYDAVVLGWGSLACVLEDEARLRLLRACDALCPEGPILASFVASRGVLRRGLGPAGRRAARALGSDVPESVGLLSNAGFVRPLTREDASALGRAVGRSTTWEQPGFALVAWHRGSTPA